MDKQIRTEEVIMPSCDISMCVGGDCPLKKDCYRYRAIPHVRQTFFTIPPREGRDCKYFWQLEKEHKIRCMDEIEKKTSTNTGETGRQLVDVPVLS